MMFESATKDFLCLNAEFEDFSCPFPLGKNFNSFGVFVLDIVESLRMAIPFLILLWFIPPWQFFLFTGCFVVLIFSREEYMN